LAAGAAGAISTFAAAALADGRRRRRSVEERIALVPTDVDQDADTAVLHQRRRGGDGQRGRRRVVAV